MQPPLQPPSPKKKPPVLPPPRLQQQRQAQQDLQSNDRQSAKKCSRNWTLLRLYRIWGRRIMRRPRLLFCGWGMRRGWVIGWARFVFSTLSFLWFNANDCLMGIARRTRRYRNLRDFMCSIEFIAISNQGTGIGEFDLWSVY